MTELATRLEADWANRVKGNLGVEALVEAARVARAYAARVPRVVNLRTRDDWNLSATLYRTRLKPLQLEVRRIAQKIADDQLKFVQRQALGLMRWSFVVLGLALLLGALSVASLYVNYRLEHRVQRALAKAASLGKYVIESRIGGGGMGEVFQARHALLRRPSAVKVLRLQQTLDADAQERFQNEVRLTSQLTHPNTIAIFDYGQTPEGLFYYAMELLNGVTLQTLVNVSGPMPASRVVHVLRQVCGSLQEAHDRGLVHRDIKPSNIMVAQLGGVLDFVKVLDFGLVTRIHAPGETNVATRVSGTPAYLAPEVITTGEAGPRSDLYAVGAVGYFLLTGRTVFERDSVPAILEAHVQQEPEPPSIRLGVEVPEALELLILACLAKDPGERPRSATELGAALDHTKIGAWTADDAAVWWDEYGEAAMASAGTSPSSRTGMSVGIVSGFEVGGASRA